MPKQTRIALDISLNSAFPWTQGHWPIKPKSPCWSMSKNYHFS